MPKQQTNDLKALSVFWLNQEGFLSGGVHAGGIRWMTGQNEWGSVKLASVLVEGYSFLRVCYWLQMNKGKGQRKYAHRIPLTSTPCFFGGERYWFLCPSCDRRSAILHLNRGVIGCRVCCDLAYESQRYFWKDRYNIFTRTIGRTMQAEDRIRNLRVKCFKNRPTKRYVRLLTQSNLVRHSLFSSLK